MKIEREEKKNSAKRKEEKKSGEDGRELTRSESRQPMQNSEIEKLIEDFLLDSKILGQICKSSCVSYRGNLKRFFEFVGKSPSDLTLDDTKRFIAEKQEAGLTARTIGGYIFALRGFVNYLRFDKNMNIDINLDRVRAPRDKEKKDVVYLTEEEINKYLSTILEDARTLPVVRFAALVVFLLETGARIGETLSIKRSEMDWEKGEVEVLGKGKKRRTLYFHKRSREMFNLYFAMRTDDTDFLFATERGTGQWKQTETDEIFRRYNEKSGIKKKISAHTCRHTFATQLIYGGKPLNEVAILLGHSSPVITLKYYVGVVEKMRIREKISDEDFKFISFTLCNPFVPRANKDEVD